MLGSLIGLIKENNVPELAPDGGYPEEFDLFEIDQIAHYRSPDPGSSPIPTEYKEINPSSIGDIETFCHHFTTPANDRIGTAKSYVYKFFDNCRF
jgi:CRP-like cAMP-binding protein